MDPTNWGEIFAALGREYGWTFREIADMTLDQIALALAGGKAPRGGVSISSDADLIQVRRNWRKYIG